MSLDGDQLTSGKGAEGAEMIRIEHPGVYELPACVYHRDPVRGGSLSSTGARKLLPPSCPALFRHWADMGQEPNRVFDFGHAAHAEVLGVGQPVRVVDADSWRTKKAQDERREAYADGAVPLLACEWKTVQEMAAALRAHPVASVLFDPDTGAGEQSLFWVDEDSGVWCRAMLDWMPHPVQGQRLIIGDYKTSQSAEPNSIAKTVAAYGYDQQAAWYLNGVTALGLHGDIEPAFVFIFQEKTAPYLVTIAQPDAEALMWGERLNRKAIDIYRTCIETGRWPGYADDVISVGLPTWTVRNREYAWENGELDMEALA